ncbi:hypothetical protein KKF04_02785 [Patescibacteria group bacterium]|nr:hypothetical protein [Patescibacteria group bacterium]
MASALALTLLSTCESGRHNVGEVLSPSDLDIADTASDDDISSGQPVLDLGPRNILIEQDGVKPGLIEIGCDYNGSKWIGKLQGNGNRDVLIYIPSGVNTASPFEIIYHFHGTHSQLVKEVIPELPGTSERYRGKAGHTSPGENRLRQVLDASQNLGEGGRNVITVYPLSAGRRGKKGNASDIHGFDSFWMLTGGNDTGDDMHMLHAEVLAVVENELIGMPIVVDSITAKGHSAGGRPLENIAASGFPLDRIDFLDASYGRWTTHCHRDAIAANPDVQMNIFYIPNTPTQADAKRLEGKTGVRLIPTSTPHADMNSEFFGWNRD